jgi:hypothetical protein
MADYSSFDPKEIEDRREEFSPYQHLLMALGIPPMVHGPYRESVDGSYNSQENLENPEVSAAARARIPSALGLDLGAINLPPVPPELVASLPPLKRISK